MWAFCSLPFCCGGSPNSLFSPFYLIIVLQGTALQTTQRPFNFPCVLFYSANWLVLSANWSGNVKWKLYYSAANSPYLAWVDDAGNCTRSIIAMGSASEFSRNLRGSFSATRNTCFFSSVASWQTVRLDANPIQCSWCCERITSVFCLLWHGLVGWVLSQYVILSTPLAHFLLV